MKATFFAFLLFFVFVSQNIFAQNSPAETARIERLVGLAKVWGNVKYFHPFLAYRDIDWDKALVETIPKVNAAKNSQEYAAAINSMLAILGDKNTRAEIIGTETKSIKPTNAVETKESIRLENGALILDLMQIARIGAKNQDDLQEIYKKMGEMFPQAKTLIFDARGRDLPTGENAEAVNYYAAGFLRDSLPSLLDENLKLASVRYRVHNGYTPQWGSSSGGYYSAFTTDAPVIFEGSGDAKLLPTVFIVNEKSPSSGDILSGLQSANKALVVQDGDLAEEPGIETSEIKLPENVRVKIRSVELVAPDGSVGFQADKVVPKSANGADDAMNEALKLAAQKDFKRPVNNNSAVVPLESVKDKPYPEMEFPAAEYRLLALFRYWNVINYFYPYKDLIDRPWDEILPEYITMFEANKDASDYQLTVLRMVAELDDSHGGVRFSNPSKAGETLGRFFPPLNVKYVAGQTIVLNVIKPNAGVSPGDVITAIDGIPIEKYRAKFAVYNAASTEQALQRVVHFSLLRGQKDTKIKLNVRGLDGKTREVELVRNVPTNDPRWEKAYDRSRKTPVFEVLPSGFGYADLARLQVGEVDKMFEMLKDTPAIIFDMRGYPNGTAWSIAPRLTEKKKVAAALFSRPFLSGKLASDEDGASYSFTQYLPERVGDVYRGKVVMLIDENAVSQSEHTCMFFEAARADITFIGTTTMGANGDVTYMLLPGNLTVAFTGHNVRHANGHRLQRIGIQPTIKVEPTIKGTIEGKDEILEAAVNFLQTGEK